MAQLKCWGFSVSSFDQHAVLLAFIGSLVLTKHKCLGDFRHWNSHIIHDYCPFRPIASWENMLIPWQGAFEGYRAPICCRVQKTMDCPEPEKKTVCDEFLKVVDLKNALKKRLVCLIALASSPGWSWRNLEQEPNFTGS